MARKPSYGKHKGQARTTFNGKRVYLGQFGSPESHAKFQQIMAQWEADHAKRGTTMPVAMTVNRVAYLFLKHAETEYVRDGVPTGEAANFRHALKNLTSCFHGVRVLDFGPKKLKDLVARMVDSGLSQSSVNSRLRRIKQVFDWAVSEELIPVTVAEALRTVKGIRVGKTKAAPPTPKPAVSISHVEAVKPFLTRPVWEMVQFMLLTGCRPSEAVRVRWSEISTVGKVWSYVPKHHKTSHKLCSRRILIGPLCQQVLTGLREHSRSDYVFDPQVGLEDFVRKAYRAGAGARKVGARYSVHSLNSAVRNACDRAGVPRWSPGQLRKTRATLARQQGDLETAQQVLGHASKQTTERHYAEVDLSRAEANVLLFG